MLRLSQEGIVVERPKDIVKQPTVLEFLGMDDKSIYHESDFENALIGRMQEFLMEMDQGYLFEARQKLFAFDGENFYVDLFMI